VTTPLERVRRRASRVLYRQLNRLYRTLFPTDAPAGHLRPASVRRVLVVRHDAVGDMAVTLPALAYLSATLPAAEIDVVASPRNAALLHGDARVRRVEVNDHSWRCWLRLVRTLRARRYDVVVSPLMSRGLREGLFAGMVARRHGARVSLWRQPQYVGLFTHLHRVSRAHRHMATRLLALVQATIGDGAPARPDVAQWPAVLARDAAAEGRVDAFLCAHVRGPFVALNAWAAEPARALGRALTTELACALAGHDAGLTVVLTPPPSVVGEAEGVAADAAARLGDAGRVIVARPGPTLRDLVALLRRAAVVVTPDTANVHLASAVGTPVVSIHTPLAADVRDWGPWGVPNRTVVLPDARPLRETDPAVVLCAFDALVRELGLGVSALARPTRERGRLPHPA
jgi:ADP-heptose:LPS heptosyltransferase